MRIGILQADSVMDQFQPRHGNYPEMFRAILDQAAGSLGKEVSFETYDVEHDVYPSQPRACDGYVITGSRKSVYDDEPWIHKLQDYVRELHAKRIKLVGVCFGHQLIAHALGGRTEGAAEGWGVGIHEAEVLAPGWFMDDNVERYSLVVSHRDQVTELPKDAQLIASSDFCPNSMFCVGNHMLAVQGHPEFTTAYSKELMEMREEILGPEKFATGISSLSKTLMREDVARWIIRFIDGSPLVP